jgi:hypothetical protein
MSRRMTAALRQLLSQLRCVDCGQAPTEAEVDEMAANCGAKVKPGDKLVRLCRRCTDAARACAG